MCFVLINHMYLDIITNYGKFCFKITLQRYVFRFNQKKRTYDYGIYYIEI